MLRFLRIRIILRFVKTQKIFCSKCEIFFSFENKFPIFIDNDRREDEDEANIA